MYPTTIFTTSTLFDASVNAGVIQLGQSSVNEEVKLLTVRIKPLVDDVAALHGIKFGPKTSDVLSRFYEHDETARFIFDFFVTASTNYQNLSLIHI